MLAYKFQNKLVQKLYRPNKKKSSDNKKKVDELEKAIDEITNKIFNKKPKKQKK